MKKTFKKQLVLFATVMIMMIIAMVMPASAEDAPCKGKTHNMADLTPVVYAPTCTQKGYTQWRCDVCDEIIIGEPYKEDVTMETGHKYEVSYVLVDGAYKRIRTCQNELCQRAEGSLPEEKNMVAADGDIKYYLVEYWNPYALPAADAENHADYFLPEFYVKENPATWVSIAYAREQFFPVNLTANVDATKSEVKYEIIDEDGSIRLYAQEDATLPVYRGLTPTKNKNVEFGKFIFNNSWTTRIDGPKMIREAEFTGEKGFVTATFYNGNGSAVYTKSVPYGTAIAYPAEHIYPSKDADQYNKYTYTNWRLGKNGVKTFGLYESMDTLYYSTDVIPEFSTEANSYTVQFEKFGGAAIGTAVAGVQKDKSIRDILSSAGINDPEKEFFRPRDNQFIYTQQTNKWQITKVNGEEVSSNAFINSDKFALNHNIYVKNGDTLKEVLLRGNATITLAPVYTKNDVIYTLNVKIRSNYFAKDDVLDNNSGVVTSDILGKFLITLKDANGNILNQGITNKDGECTLSVAYTDTVFVYAQTKDNTKYYGDHSVALKYFNGTEDPVVNVSIAPRVTDEWLAGEKRCGCICHTFLGSFVIRLYNIIYRIFNIKYVCCDDLFVTYGDLLAYSK